MPQPFHRSPRPPIRVLYAPQTFWPPLPQIFLFSSFWNISLFPLSTPLSPAQFAILTVWVQLTNKNEVALSSDESLGKKKVWQAKIGELHSLRGHTGHSCLELLSCVYRLFRFNFWMQRENIFRCFIRFQWQLYISWFGLRVVPCSSLLQKSSFIGRGVLQI